MAARRFAHRNSESEVEHLGEPGVEAFDDDIVALGQQMAVAGQDLDLAVTGDRRARRGSPRGQQLVAIAVEQQQRPAGQRPRDLAARPTGVANVTTPTTDTGMITAVRTATAPPKLCPMTTTRDAPASRASSTPHARSCAHRSRLLGSR